jgi:hypothetical protein
MVEASHGTRLVNMNREKDGYDSEKSPRQHARLRCSKRKKMETPLRPTPEIEDQAKLKQVVVYEENLVRAGMGKRSLHDSVTLVRGSYQDNTSWSTNIRTMRLEKREDWRRKSFHGMLEY